MKLWLTCDTGLNHSSRYFYLIKIALTQVFVNLVVFSTLAGERTAAKIFYFLFKILLFFLRLIFQITLDILGVNIDRVVHRFSLRFLVFHFRNLKALKSCICEVRLTSYPVLNIASTNRYFSSYW